MNENANVYRAIKTDSDILHYTNRTKRLMKNTKKKTIEQYRVREDSPVDGVDVWCNYCNTVYNVNDNVGVSKGIRGGVMYLGLQMGMRDN